MKVIIIGTKRSESVSKKTGQSRVCFTYYYQRPFSAYDEENSECLGFSVGSEFSYTDFGVKPLDEVELVYEPGYEGKAMLVDIMMIKPHIPPTESKQEQKSSKGVKEDLLPFN